MAVLSKNNLSFGSVSVTADGVKKLSTLMSELCQLVDFTKVKAGSYIDIGGRIHSLSFKSTPYVYFSSQVLASADLTIYGIAMNPANNSCDVLYWQNTNASTISSQNNEVFSNGTVITFYY